VSVGSPLLSIMSSLQRGNHTTESPKGVTTGSRERRSQVRATLDRPVLQKLTNTKRGVLLRSERKVCRVLATTWFGVADNYIEPLRSAPLFRRSLTLPVADLKKGPVNCWFRSTTPVCREDLAHISSARRTQARAQATSRIRRDAYRPGFLAALRRGTNRSARIESSARSP